MKEPFTLPEYDPAAYPLTEDILSLYDEATDWMTRAPYSHRELFRLACQNLEAQLQLAEAKAELQETDRQLAEAKAELQENRLHRVILKSLKQGYFQG